MDNVPVDQALVMNDPKPERSTENSPIVPMIKATCKEISVFSGPYACFIRGWQKKRTQCVSVSHLGERYYIIATQTSQPWLVARRVGLGEETR